MATRSTISLVVKDGDMNKTFHFDRNKLPKSVAEFPHEFINEIGDVTINNEVLTIYHHWDGYPEGVGATLLKDYNDYDTILNLMCGGDASSINGGTCVQYCAWRGEKWETNKPTQCKENEVKCTEEYVYLFKDGKWLFKDWEAKEWTDLAEWLAEHKEEDENE